LVLHRAQPSTHQQPESVHKRRFSLAQFNLGAVVGAPRQAQQIALALSGVDRKQHGQTKIRRRGLQESRYVLVVPNLVDAGAVIKLADLGARIFCNQPAIVSPRKNARQSAIGIVGLSQRRFCQLIAPVEKLRSRLDDLL
jgi:hypothetical protein